ncbi:flagellar protein FlgN [Planomicrobium sp. CPCC 101110]|uniref:flagellar protein FlgN n=1 Tax=Planomicrobium sp. CPCC 101110 TaxID=2599619 RepID=UPI0011B79B9A|nr:flagellar protein FlgN [Planomicrobium sp. CPCC 101110]TWT27817.1 flagellar protein FlgN [Planomicrobium sp. CPCC 101110]
MLQSVVATLDELIMIQKQLIDFADQKRTILIERNINELNLLVKQEAKLIKQLGRVDQQRERLVYAVLENHPGISFSQFVDQLPDEEMRHELQSCITALQAVLVELQAKNRVNERLLQDAMNFVQHMIDQVTTVKNQNFNYRSPLAQQKTQTSSRGFFDTKA